MAFDVGGFGVGVERGVRIGLALDSARQQRKRSELEDMLIKEKLTSLKDSRTRQEVRQAMDQASAIRGALAARKKAGLPIDSGMLDVYNQHITTTINKAYGDVLGERLFAGLRPTERGTAVPIVIEKGKDGEEKQLVWNQNLGFDDSAPPLELTREQLDQQLFRLDSIVDLINESGEAFDSDEIQHARRAAEVGQELKEKARPGELAFEKQKLAAQTDEKIRLYKETGYAPGMGRSGGLTAKARDYEYLRSKNVPHEQAMTQAFGNRASTEVGKTARELLKQSKDPITNKPTITLEQAYDQAAEQYMRSSAIMETEDEDAEPGLGAGPDAITALPGRETPAGPPALRGGIDPDAPPPVDQSRSGLIDRSGAQAPTPNGEASQDIDLLKGSATPAATETSADLTEARTFANHPFGGGQQAVTIRPESWKKAVNLLFKDPSESAVKEFAEFAQLPIETVKKMVKMGRTAALSKNTTPQTERSARAGGDEARLGVGP